MNLGFQDQFIPMVEDGSKTHTIRGGQRWKVGMRADLFRESRRTKVYELREKPGDADCICSEPGTLLKNSKRVYGRPLCSAEHHNRYEQVQVSGMRLIFRAPVVRVQEIRFEVWGPAHINYLDAERLLAERIAVYIDGEELGSDELDLFAWRDGFRPWKDDPTLTTMAFDHMALFWQRRHKICEKREWRGQIVHWDYAARFDVNGATSTEQVADAIRMYGYEPDMAALAALTAAERKQVETYCYKAHLRASDNRCRVPKKPAGFDDLLRVNSMSGDWSEACRD